MLCDFFSDRNPVAIVMRGFVKQKEDGVPRKQAGGYTGSAMVGGVLQADTMECNKAVGMASKFLPASSMTLFVGSWQAISEITITQVWGCCNGHNFADQT